MTKRQFLMSTTSTLKPHVVVPADFADDPISRFWRGVMFGWDANRELEFRGLLDVKNRFTPVPLDTNRYGDWAVDPVRRLIHFSEVGALEFW